MTDLARFQERLTITFSDLALLQRALTHRSYVNEHPEQLVEDNERLEFLGDAVLDFVTGAWLYARFPDLDEGSLTRLRASLVRTETLATFARQYGLGEVLLLGRGEDESGGRTRSKNLCGGFEAVIGAMYLDLGMDMVREFVWPLLGRALDDVLLRSSDKDAKSMFQEWSQAMLGLTPIYRTVASEGPDHAKEFRVEVMIGARVVGTGTGHSKQIAEQGAARQALSAVEAGELSAGGRS